MSKYDRKQPFRTAKEEVLVVCGGQTEEIYFKAFNKIFRPSLGRVSIVTAVEAKNPMQIVEYAIKAWQRNDAYNAVWCVFDKDDFTDFDEAIIYAEKNGIGTAFSNQAFEVWFICHFREQNAPLNRSQYKRELTKLLDFEYGKDAATISKVSEFLLDIDKTNTAIDNARLAYEKHVAFTIPKQPSA
ncbi:MAG: RloB family protein [Oscillospiraceae bacterium]|jgi:hypothetical protein|nr:RloB family protein [Oscillospiraceae bacterium]